MHLSKTLRARRAKFAGALLFTSVVAAACASDNSAEGDRKVRTPPEEAWRADKPEATEAPEVKLPSLTEAKLKSGLTVIVSEEHQLPIVHLSFAAPAGANMEKAREAGVAQLAWGMLDEGAGKMDAIALADAIAAIGTSVHIGVGRESGSASMKLLKRNLEEGTRLLSLMVQKPKFAQADFDRVRARHISALKERAGNPRAVAADVFDVTAYGKDHPYGWRTAGNEKTVGKLNARGAKRFFTNNVGPKNAVLVFTGDITLDEAVKIANTHFGRWRGRAKTPKPPKPSAEAQQLTLRLVDFPGAPQTVVSIGRPLATVGDEDEAAMLVMNQVLGGMFSSRLNLNLREDKGWTYGAWSRVSARRAPGPFSAGASIKSDHTAEAVAEMLKEFAALAEKGVKDDDELQIAKDNAVKSLPGRFETVNSTAGAAAGYFLSGRPLDYHQTLPEKVAAVTADQVKAAAARALKKDGLVVILVGDAASILEPVTKLELGEVMKVDALGEPVSE